MALTALQKAILKAYIEANGTWMAYANNGDGAVQIALDLQAEATPAYVVWRTSVPEEEYTEDTSWQGTNWSWTEYISRSVGEKFGYGRMFWNGSIDPSKANIRQGFVDVFSGAGQSSVDQRVHMAAVSKRNANLLEELFGVGTGTLGSPSVMAVENTLSAKEIQRTMEW